MSSSPSSPPASKRGEQSLHFLCKYLEDEKRRRAQEADVDSTTSGLEGLGSQSGYRLHHQLRNSLRDFSYHDVPATIRNRLRESKSHRLTRKDIECEVYDWVFQHLEEK